ncbi:hypothetical protein Pan97_00460 [Bremerella volcania]|uniref:Uncharacterized protein n=1 Tax=Bremerella volcania TaxID=2527984 RepID=A0A518C1H7_9BACT|nr:hypothetical protein [Bremerella volcania]QDU73079.1 hypothetical protein Pan97_00460 [Bremerella volcania]
MKLLREVAVSLLIVGVCYFFFAHIVFRGVDPSTLGSDPPVSPPEEVHRVVSPAGFSIVAPKNWGSAFPDSPEIQLRPRTAFPGRCGFFSVMKVGPWDPKSEGYLPITFQGQKAWQRIESRPTTFDDPAVTYYELTFERDGQWYYIKYGVQEEWDEPSEIVRQYLDTFRIEP